MQPYLLLAFLNPELIAVK